MLFFCYIRKRIFYFCTGVAVLCFGSCQDTTPADNSTTVRPEAVVDRPVSFVQDEPLTLPRYLQWLRAQKGITYDARENAEVALSLLYKPLVFEAAVSGGNNSQEELERLMKIKKGYHHLVLEWRDKKTSLGSKTDKEAQFESISKNFFAVKNGGDTLRNVILEFFPATLLNQPHKVMVLIPRDTTDTALKAGVKGEAFGLEDVSVSIRRDQFKLFPEIKI